MPRLTHLVFVFQFQSGAIKSTYEKKLRKFFARFNSNLVRLRALKIYTKVNLLTMFQFQSGAIKRYLLGG